MSEVDTPDLNAVVLAIPENPDWKAIQAALSGDKVSKVAQKKLSWGRWILGGAVSAAGLGVAGAATQENGLAVGLIGGTAALLFGGLSMSLTRAGNADSAETRVALLQRDFKKNPMALSDPSLVTIAFRNELVAAAREGTPQALAALLEKHEGLLKKLQPNVVSAFRVSFWDSRQGPMIADFRTWRESGKILAGMVVTTDEMAAQLAIRLGTDPEKLQLLIENSKASWTDVQGQEWAEAYLADTAIGLPLTDFFETHGREVYLKPSNWTTISANLFKAIETSITSALEGGPERIALFIEAAEAYKLQHGVCTKLAKKATEAGFLQEFGTFWLAFAPKYSNLVMDKLSLTETQIETIDGVDGGRSALVAELAIRAENVNIMEFIDAHGDEWTKWDECAAIADQLQGVDEALQTTKNDEGDAGVKTEWHKLGEDWLRPQE